MRPTTIKWTTASKVEKLVCCAALALASVGMLALPSAASAHETGTHDPVTKACPPGGATQNAVCFALRGVEYSLRHGGTTEAADELAGNTQGNVTEYQGDVTGAVETYQNDVSGAAMAFKTTMVTVGTTFKTSLEMATQDLHEALDAGIVNAIIGSDSYAAGAVSAIQTFLESEGVAPCPVNPPTPLFPQTVGALSALSCSIWASLPADVSALQAHLLNASDALVDISLPFAEALTALGTTLGQATVDLGVDTEEATGILAGGIETATNTAAAAAAAATDAAGAAQVFDTFYAVQCVRRGDYGVFTRPTPCPPTP